MESPSTRALLRPDEERLLAVSRPRRSRRLPRRELLAELLLALAFVGGCVAVAIAAPGAGPAQDTGLALALAGAFAVASRVEFHFGAVYTNPTQLVFVPMLLLLPLPLVAPFVALGYFAAKLPDLLSGRTPADRSVLLLGDSVYALAPVAVLAAAGHQEAAWDQWPVYLAALAAQLVLDAGAGTLREWLSTGAPPRIQAELQLPVSVADAMLSPIGLLAVFAAAEQPFAALLVLPLIGLIEGFARERERRVDAALELSAAYRGTAMLLGEVVEADDAYTGEHSRGVVALALEVGGALGLADTERRELEFAALLHDVGKIAIPKEIINKPSKLTDEEFAIVKTHTVEGQRLLKAPGGLLARVGDIVRSCHERWDGGGYPDGLAGEEIPRAARIVFACDAFNAMVTDRPYRAGRPAADALAELRECAGTQFDPLVVAALCAVVGRGLAHVPASPAPAGQLASA